MRYLAPVFTCLALIACGPPTSGGGGAASSSASAAQGARRVASLSVTRGK